MRSVEGKYPLTWVAWRKNAWLPTYELRRDESTNRWTWFLVEEFYRDLLEEAIHYTRTGNWPRLVGHLKTLAHLPMFGGIFYQVQDIRRRVQALWGDTHLRSPNGQWKSPPWKTAGGLAQKTFSGLHLPLRGPSSRRRPPQDPGGVGGPEAR
jgi:hypothetical protein